MNKCGEERRRLAAEWAEYFTQQKLSKERAEREAERALQADSQREGTIISLTKVGLRASVALTSQLCADDPRPRKQEYTARLSKKLEEQSAPRVTSFSKALCIFVLLASWFL